MSKSSLADDRRCVEELRELWQRRPASFRKWLAFRWLDRARNLLVEVCRREGLTIEAERMKGVARIEGPAEVYRLALLLYELARGINENRAVTKSVDIAVLTLALRSAVFALDLEPGSGDDSLEVVALRLRQVARAARCLDDESHRMFVDLADA